MTMTRLKSPEAAAAWLREHVSGALRTDSRRVQPGDGFVAWPGYAVDGRQFARAALAAGASACLVEHQGAAEFAFDHPRIASLPGLKAAAGAVADSYYGQPSRRLDVVATTGTNGKTSTAWWTAQALGALGRRCGVVGTLGIGEPPAGGAQTSPLQPTGLTTPDPVQLHATLRGFADAGFAACAIEASSIGIEEHRLDGVRVAVAMFTNLTRDHLDYHGDMDAYWAAKRKLFAWPGLRAAVVNVDDVRGAELAEDLARRAEPELWTYSIAGPARLAAHRVRHVDGGLAFDLVEAGGTALPVRTALVGGFNAGNLLAVVAALRALGVPLTDAARVLPGLGPVPGRLERVDVPGLDMAPLPEVVVDYAHTPDALDKAIAALRPLAAQRGGRLWCVFGCGGDRDASKRAPMGAVAERGADHVVLTSDNPRGESPAAILAQIAAGLSQPARARTIEDRREAIATVLLDAGAHDVVLLAGKGHEDYQEVAGERRPFSDVDEARAVLRARALASSMAAAPGVEATR